MSQLQCRQREFFHWVFNAVINIQLFYVGKYSYLVLDIILDKTRKSIMDHCRIQMRSKSLKGSGSGFGKSSQRAPIFIKGRFRIRSFFMVGSGFLDCRICFILTGGFGKSQTYQKLQTQLYGTLVVTTKHIMTTSMNIEYTEEYYIPLGSYPPAIIGIWLTYQAEMLMTDITEGNRQ